MTAIRDSGAALPAVADPEGMGRVRRLHGQLSGVVRSLNDKVAEVLQRQESEFLSAYRGHMYTVQKELQAWRDKADAARLRQERDARLARLTAECAWFRKEALRLNDFCGALRRELETVKEQLSATEDDRGFLERQTLALKKENVLLRAELELRMAGGGGSREVSSSSGFPVEVSSGTSRKDVNGGGGGGSSFLPKIHSKSGAVEEDQEEERHMMVREEEEEEEEDLGRVRQESSTMSIIRADQLQRLEAQNEQMRAQLLSERSRLKRLRAQLESHQSQRSELERLFEACVNDVRRHAAARKRAAAMEGNVAAASTAAKDRVADVSDLTGADRRTVIRRLVEDDFVLESLHRLIFRSRQDDPGNEPPPSAQPSLELPPPPNAPSSTLHERVFGHPPKRPNPTSPAKPAPIRRGPPKRK